MEGKISHFRQGRHTYHNNQMIIKVNDLSRDKSKNLINKNVIWVSKSGKEIKGIITNTHGNKGALRVKFERGLPGQSIGTKVKVQ
mgnify:FL=1